MILKVRNLDNDAWNYFDNVNHVSVDKGKWCFVQDKGTDWLYAVKEAVSPVVIGSDAPEKVENKRYINTGVVSYCSHIFIPYENIRYNDIEKEDLDAIQTVDLIRFSVLGSDEETTIAVYRNTDAFILNAEGKTIERII